MRGSRSSDYDLSSSTILTTRFGQESSRLIHSVTKYLYTVIGLITSIAALSLLNVLGLLDYFSSSGIDRVVDTILLIALIVVLIPLVLLLLRSRKVLDRWTDMFERNTIATAMRISMTSRGKEEAILALVQSVDEISEPLEEYIMSKKSDLTEFLDVSVGISNTRTTYDILIDSSHVLNGDHANKGNNLRKVLEDYGAVIIKIVDGYIDRSHVESFVDSLAKYASASKNQIGVGILIGEDISAEAKESVSKFISERRRRLPINQLLLIDKPSSPSAPPPLHSTEQSSPTQ
ncbi:MAG: hypothetical protein M3044_09210 [Thermoproteota archaeon]|nr:hypothetical protein [Thermoproteota archaeon]